MKKIRFFDKLKREGKDLRIDSQYHIDIRILKKDAEKMVESTEDFILEIRTMISEFNLERIETLRRRFQGMK